MVKRAHDLRISSFTKCLPFPKLSYWAGPLPAGHLSVTTVVIWHELTWKFGSLVASKSWTGKRCQGTARCPSYTDKRKARHVEGHWIVAEIPGFRTWNRTVSLEMIICENEKTVCGNETRPLDENITK